MDQCLVWQALLSSGGSASPRFPSACLTTMTPSVKSRVASQKTTPLQDTAAHSCLLGTQLQLTNLDQRLTQVQQFSKSHHVISMSVLYSVMQSDPRLMVMFLLHAASQWTKLCSVGPLHKHFPCKTHVSSKKLPNTVLHSSASTAYMSWPSMALQSCGKCMCFRLKFKKVTRWCIWADQHLLACIAVLDS